MSGICGLLKTNGEPVSEADLAKTMEAMAYWGPDGRDTWREKTTGLGHLKLCITPESLHESLPFSSSCGNFVIVSQGRLDNREELLRTFAIDPIDAPTTPDSSLMLQAFLKWEEDCCSHLLGDWSFAVWDRQRERLFLARDHYGMTALYYFQMGTLFGFASALKGLLANYPVEKKLNPEILIKLLINQNDQGEQTVYKNVYRLPPAHFMWVELKTKEVRIQQYWYLERTPELHYQSENDYFEHFQEIFEEAVQCRLRSFKPVGIALSGGLDSGSVAAVAAKQLQAQSKTLHAFTSVPLFAVPDRKHVIADETANVEETAAWVGNTKTARINAQERPPLEWLHKSLDLLGQPVYPATNLSWLLSLRERAQSMDVGPLLSGSAGNGGISYRGNERLFSLLFSGESRTLLRELQQWSVCHDTTLSRAFWGHILRPLLSWSKNAAGRFLPAGSVDMRRYWLVNSDTLRRHHVEESLYKQYIARDFDRLSNRRKNQLSLLRPGRASGRCVSAEISAFYSLEYRDPTMDKRVLEFCLAIPDKLFFADGMDRNLIRRAMKGRLPARILSNRRFGLQSADIDQRLLHAKPQIEPVMEMLAKSELVNEYLDLPKLKYLFSRLGENIDLDEKDLLGKLFMRGLGVALFLHDFEQA
jgi:asparagine synthase (glutamine-hydrolysing)